MSLDVPVALLERAERGTVTEDEFVACVRDSLPYAWQVVSMVSTDLAAQGGELAEHSVPPPGEAERGQLLRALASDAIRGGLERHFGVRLAFQNCHRVAAFAPGAAASAAYREFVSPAGGVRKPTPETRHRAVRPRAGAPRGPAPPFSLPPRHQAGPRLRARLPAGADPPAPGA